MKELNFIKSGDYYVPDIRLSKPNPRAMANTMAKMGTIASKVLYVSADALFTSLSLVKRLMQR